MRLAVDREAAARYQINSADVQDAIQTAVGGNALTQVLQGEQRYDLVMRRDAVEIPAVKAFLDVLQRATLRRKLEMLAGYDTAQTGTVIA